MSQTAATIGDRDRQILELLAEHRVLVGLHVQALLGVGADAAARRLRRLREAGLIRSERVFEGYPAAIWISPRGLAAIESRLPAPKLDLRGYRHDIGLGWLWLAARNGAFGAVAEQISERSMQSLDRRADRPGAPFGVGLGIVGPGGGEQLHYPDLLLTLADGRRLAIELELTRKGRARLDRIMLGYAADGRIDDVLYLVPSRAAGRPVEEAAGRAGLSGAVHIQLLAPGTPTGAPDPGRESGYELPRRQLARAGAAREAAGAATER